MHSAFSPKSGATRLTQKALNVCSGRCAQCLESRALTAYDHALLRLLLHIHCCSDQVFVQTALFEIRYLHLRSTKPKSCIPV